MLDVQYWLVPAQPSTVSSWLRCVWLAWLRLSAVSASCLHNVSNGAQPARRTRLWPCSFALLLVLYRLYLAPHSYSLFHSE